MVKKRKRTVSTLKKTRRSRSVEKRFERQPFQSAATPTPRTNPIEAHAVPYNDLPFSYNETKLILLVRDPTWAYSYWDFSEGTWHWIEKLRSGEPGMRPLLRVYNMNQENHFDLAVQLEAKNWYIDLGLPDTTFEAELGLLDSRGKFYVIARSNRVRTPRNGPSPNIDPEWSYGPSEFEELYKLSGVHKTGHGSEIFSQFRRR